MGIPRLQIGEWLPVECRKKKMSTRAEWAESHKELIVCKVNLLAWNRTKCNSSIWCIVYSLRLKCSEWRTSQLSSNGCMWKILECSRPRYSWHHLHLQIPTIHVLFTNALMLLTTPTFPFVTGKAIPSPVETLASISFHLPVMLFLLSPPLYCHYYPWTQLLALTFGRKLIPSSHIGLEQDPQPYCSQPDFVLDSIHKLVHLSGIGPIPNFVHLVLHLPANGQVSFRYVHSCSQPNFVHQVLHLPVNGQVSFRYVLRCIDGSLGVAPACVFTGLRV